MLCFKSEVIFPGGGWYRTDNKISLVQPELELGLSLKITLREYTEVETPHKKYDWNLNNYL